MLPEEFSQEVLILRTGRLKEADLWLRFLTPEKGVISAFAFGGLRSRRRFPGCLEPLSRVFFKIVRQGRAKYYFLREGSLIDRFAHLHQRPSRLGMAVNCVKFVEAAHIGEDGSRAVFSLLLRTLSVLNTAEWTPESLPLYFRARLASEYGYRPEFGGCASCGAPAERLQRASFSLSRGAVQCAECGFFPDGDVLSGEALLHLFRVIDGNPEDWAGLQYRDSASLRQACLVLERFVEYHLALIWDSGGFRKD
ncbi:MAG: DNA repair protein RecO [Desulfohalobiaceae bacterium]|nr:DNA repair protein RecO [Desulfohalobiaceae bacterium]